jgi:dihydropteroate synthase
MSGPTHNPIPAPAPIRCGDRVLDFGRRVALMGIVNVTPDSFSDGGRFFDRSRAIDQALALAEAGADVIDIGGESTRPGSDPVPAAAELERVLPVIEAVAPYALTPISIDTTKAAVAEAALAAGAALVNDVGACRFDPDMPPLLARTGVPVVIMHMRGRPKTMQRGPIHYDDLLGEIRGLLQRATEDLVAAGVERSRIIWDPGIGFGKTAVHNLMILHRIGELAAAGHAVLVGPSRKAFIGKLLDDRPADRRRFGTAAAVAACVLHGAHLVRVHDVAEMRDVVRVAEAIRDAQAAERRSASKTIRYPSNGERSARRD